MPLVFLNRTARQNSRLTAFVYGELKVRKIKQKELADYMGISQQALQQKLRNNSFRFDDFVQFAHFFKLNEADVARLVGIGE